MVQPLAIPACVKRADRYEEVRPLVELCKAGKLFEVQEWIASGRPVNGPVPPAKGRRPQTPLDEAVQLGFHSLVKVLLEAGAVDEADSRPPLIYEVIHKRRPDLVELFVENGFDPATIDMSAVFESWDTDLMEYFVQRGASLEAGQPFAHAFCSRIRTAFKLYKAYIERSPSLKEQANVALRYHAKDGNLKWVSLMLWAGADPFARGAEKPGEELSEGYEGHNALELAAIYNHFDVFGLKGIKLNPKDPRCHSLTKLLDGDQGIEILHTLLKGGLNPNDPETGACEAFSTHLWRMGWDFSPSWSWSTRKEEGCLDTRYAREGIKAIHVLAKFGGNWSPPIGRGINDARRSLVKLQPDYTIEFDWIMYKYQACPLETIEKLISTPKMKRHLAKSSRIRDILQKWRAM